MPSTPSDRTAPRPVTVSIVSHGQLDMILPLLEQLDRFSAPLLDKVVLTHNLPEPDLLAGLHIGFALQRIHSTLPMDFGANNSQAFKHCGSEWFLLLNPDIRFDGEVLAPLVELAAPRAGLLGPRILEPGKTEPEQLRRII